MNEYKLFIEYIKHHIPSFLKFSHDFNTYGFCTGQSCDDCKVSLQCGEKGIPTIKKEVVLDYRKKYPEKCI